MKHCGSILQVKTFFVFTLHKTFFLFSNSVKTFFGLCSPEKVFLETRLPYLVYVISEDTARAAQKFYAGHESDNPALASKFNAPDVNVHVIRKNNKRILRLCSYLEKNLLLRK